MPTQNTKDNQRVRSIGLLTVIDLYGNTITVIIAILRLGGLIEISILSVLICFGIFGGISVIAEYLIKSEINRTNGTLPNKDFQQTRL